MYLHNYCRDFQVGYSDGGGMKMVIQEVQEMKMEFLQKQAQTLQEK